MWSSNEATVRAFSGGPHPVSPTRPSSGRGELLEGKIKVDQVPKKQLGKADASYSTEGMEKYKGDTIYVPESLSIDNVAHRSQIIHELQHAVQERSASGGLIRVDVEEGAYRVQARHLLEQIAPLAGDEREAAVKQVVKITNPILIRALILESWSDKDRFEMVIVDINSEMPKKPVSASVTSWRSSEPTTTSWRPR